MQSRLTPTVQFCTIKMSQSHSSLSYLRRRTGAEVFIDTPQESLPEQIAVLFLSQSHDENCISDVYA